jgi:8-oxo-dGTP pyrophosphatase MutT (NUDIX family)
MSKKIEIKRWETLGREQVTRTPIFALERVRRRHAEDGREGQFYAIRSPDWVNIIAVTPEGEVVLVRQYRHGIDAVSLEIPGGVVDGDEAPLAAAMRELQEETGYVSTRWEQVGYVTANPAFMTNGCTTFLALDATCERAVSFDEHEELAVELVPEASLHELVERGEIDHAIVICAAYHLLRYRARQSS